MLFANRDSLNATIYFLEVTTTIVIAKKSLNLDEVLELLYQYYKTHIAIFFRVSPMYFVAYVFPRDKNLWVFGSYENSFDGNAKYLFIYINQSMPHIRAVWITKDKQIKRLINQLGFRAQLKHSFIGYYYSLRASVYFYNNTYS
ncbi:MAG: CDP-glycerol glycerophosphotransferase family protein, partial [Candidatus Micrarchaeaceae archaeon]